MSANHARRHRTGRSEVVDLGRRRTERVLGLIALRDRLAAAAAEYEAHDLDGTIDMLQQVYEIESAIRSMAPRIYQERWTEWVEKDSKLSHDPSEPHPSCSVCKLLQLRPEPTSLPQPGRVG